MRIPPSLSLSLNGKGARRAGNLAVVSERSIIDIWEMEEGPIGAGQKTKRESETLWQQHLAPTFLNAQSRVAFY